MALRSFAALLVLVVALMAAPVAGLGNPVPGAATGTGGATGGVQEATTTAGTAGPTTATPTAVDRSTLPPSEVIWTVTLQPNGNAHWRVGMTVPIRDEHDETAFLDLAESFENSENPLGTDFFSVAAEEASVATGREMRITEQRTNTDRRNETGVLMVTFVWTNFARVEGDRLYVGDAFNTTQGTWLPAITERQTLRIIPPSGYGVTSAPSVGITDGAARWEGPYNLSGREPWVVYSGDAPTPTPTPTPTSPNVTTSPRTGTPGTDAPDGPLGSILPVVGLAVIAGVAAAALVVYMRREDGGVGAIGGTGDDGDGGTGAATGDAANDASTDSTTGTAGTDAPDASSGADDAASGGAGAAAAAGATAGAADEADDTDDIDEELLSDEERVERLLERNGGRMKQASIVKETGWSNAKVSQLLSSMADEGRIDKLRIGRENLISFPDEDVTDIDSSE